MADQILQDIKDRLNVVDVLSSYIQLKKAGTSYKALCPFHNERTSSLVVSPQKQIWHCFGCGEGGDIFGFVIRYENVDFKEALKILAQKAGVEIPQFRQQNPKEQEEKDLSLRVNDFSARLYHEILTKDVKGREALKYLEKRGLTQGTIKQWLIGFAPDDYHFLQHSLAQKGIKEDQAVRAGVLAKGEKGNFYDRFRGRVTFPIFNYFGEIVGFSARILNDDGKSAKYINSPETAVYNKSQVMFGLNFAKDEIRKKDEMVIVEGQMDCISLHQAGFKNVIASSGTAYNEKATGFTQARRLSKNIKLCFDSDTAGRLAMRKAGEMLLRLGFRIKIIILKAVKDPDELVKKSPGLWAKAVTEAVWFLDFYINLAKEKFASDPVEQKHYLTQEVLPFLGFISDPLEQDHYIGQMVKEFGISEKVIREQIKVPGKAVKPEEAGAEFKTVGNNRLLVIEKEVLGGILANEEFFNEIKGYLEPLDFETSEIGQLAMAKVQGSLGTKEIESVLAKECVFMVESFNEQQDNKALIKRLLKSYSLLKANSLKKKQKFLQSEMARAEASQNKEQVRTLQEQFALVSRLRVEWENK